MNKNQKAKEVYDKMRKSPIFFIEKVWGFTPERDNRKFIKGKHITWQQHDILLAIEKAIRGEDKRRISIRSGHGIGKSCTMAWIILWFLFCHKEAQVPCTAPSSDQIYDVLWKELSKWIQRMPPEMQGQYEWTSTYLRIKDSPATWFARAKTARKESPEALAGIHADHVLMVVDEASGVAEEIYNTAEGALTNEDVYFLMISNPTRLEGYFYDSQREDRDGKNWQKLHFNSLDSAIVDRSYVERIIEKHGEDSDEYRIRVLGEFPREDMLDKKGYVKLLNKEDLNFARNEEFVGRLFLGVDPAGEGVNNTVWVVRDNFKAKVILKEPISDTKGIAEKTLTLMKHFEVDPNDVTIDNFGVGANIAQEIALAGYRVNSVNVGQEAEDKKTYRNKRAEASWRVKEWIKKGGELVGIDKWDELLVVKYKRDLSGKIKIKSKDEMRHDGEASPDVFDALMLTFVKQSNIPINNYEDIKELEESYESGEYGLQ